MRALALIPEELSGGPLVCAGVTTFNSLRNSGARPGELVAVLGLGGLGHLGVQFAAKMGFKTIAIARGSDKESLARQLGAHHYIDSHAQDVGAELIKLAGAKIILATAKHGFESFSQPCTRARKGGRRQSYLIGKKQHQQTKGQRS